jgi:hypothetical protein
MMRIRNTLDRRENRVTSPTWQARAGQNRGAAECRDHAPVLVSQIAMSFWCQPTTRTTADRQQENCDISTTRRGITMHATAEQIVTSLALVLAAAAAILTSPGLPGRMHQITQWVAAGAAAEAAANAGAIGENPELLRAP